MGGIKVLFAGFGLMVASGALAASDAVTASSFGWNATNATKCLQAALDSGARRVVVDRQAFSVIDAEQPSVDVNSRIGVGHTCDF